MAKTISYELFWYFSWTKFNRDEIGTGIEKSQIFGIDTKMLGSVPVFHANSRNTGK